MKKDRFPPLALLLFVTASGLLVWMTRNPDSSLLRRAEEWPVVGSAVSEIRQHYGFGEGTPPRADASPGVVTQKAESRGTESGTSRSASPLPRVWIVAGTPLLAAPEQGSEVELVVSQSASLSVLDREGSWHRVLHRGADGWVDLPGYGRGDLPPLGRDPAPPQPLPGRVADEELLREALELLGGGSTTENVGGYELHTDHRELEVIKMLDTVASRLEPFYAERYGVSPIDRPRESIVLFSRQQDYRKFQDGLERLSGLPAVGLVSKGLVAIFAGERRSDEVGATLIHELTHLLNRRALGPALPPWLDEGIADDLSYSRIVENGHLDPELLAGSWRDVGPTRIWRGGHAAARELRRAVEDNRSVQLGALLLMEWEEFVDPRSDLNYPQSAFFIRFLVESDPELRRGFQAYLAGIAGGGSVEPAELLRLLGRSMGRLEDDFRRWLPLRLAELEAAGDRPREP